MMDYLGFVLPSSGIEWLFFIVIFGLSVGNLVLLPLFAKVGLFKRLFGWS